MSPSLTLRNPELVLLPGHRPGLVQRKLHSGYSYQGGIDDRILKGYIIVKRWKKQLSEMTPKVTLLYWATWMAAASSRNQTLVVLVFSTLCLPGSVLQHGSIRTFQSCNLSPRDATGENVEKLDAAGPCWLQKWLLPLVHLTSYKCICLAQPDSHAGL